MLSPTSMQPYSATPTAKLNALKKNFYFSKTQVKHQSMIKILPNQNLTQIVCETPDLEMQQSVKKLVQHKPIDKALLARSKTEGSIYDNIAKRFSLRKMVTPSPTIVKEQKSNSQHSQTITSKDRIQQIIEVYSKKLPAQQKQSNTSIETRNGQKIDEQLQRVLMRVKVMCMHWKVKEKQHQATEQELRKEIARLNGIVQKQSILLSTKPFK